mmetsp:Transcript_21790/g.49350  ORF Transcript_21790/g.49350 Transcript_21790/m.49350 type:complete len:237 (-) Transcript_21790:92-802(-)
MMRRGCPEATLQVWYSSAWTAATSSTFAAALTTVVRSAKSLGTSPDVLRFLTHWMTAQTVSLEHSRQLWLVSRPHSLTGVSNFTRKVDRKALCSYYLTGQLLGGDMGSTVMFANPPGCELALDHDFLQSIHYDSLSREWASGSRSVVDAGVGIILQRLALWGGRLQRGEVLVTLQPASMSWSNVCDYCAPEDFFALARACPKALHHCYSMNWTGMSVCLSASAPTCWTIQRSAGET